MSADEHPTLPLPDPSAQWVLQTEAAAAPKRHRRWPWLVGLLIVAVLIVVAWFVGESIARGVVERTIREQISANLNIPVDHEIDVDVPGPILPQLIVGSLAEVTVSSNDVPLEGITADITAHASDVPIRGDADWSGATATVTIDQPQLQTLLEGVDGFPASTVGLDPPDVTATFDLDAVVTTIPVGVALTPSALDGKLVLTPTSLRVAGAEISADAIVHQFGAIASTVVRDWDVCIAQYLPEALTLTGVTVAADSVSADFEISSAILSDPAARANGTCA